MSDVRVVAAAAGAQDEVKHQTFSSGHLDSIKSLVLW